MCDDDDWDTPRDAATNHETRAGVISEGGCRFSSGRGFVPANQSDNWGGGDAWGDTGYYKDTNVGEDDWGCDNSSSFLRNESTDFGGGRGRGRGSRGSAGRGSSRGGRSDFANGVDRRGDFKSGRGGRGGSRGGYGGEYGGENQGGEEREKKKEYYVPPEIENVEDLFSASITTGVNFMKLDEIEVNVTGIDEPEPIATFESSGLRPHLLENVRRSGYKKPTAIQKYSIPAILKGRDLMACAQTGSGKTAAFMLPIINDLLINKNSANAENSCSRPEVVIISPTRELAIQISEQGKKFAFNSTIKVALAYGGTSTNHQRDKILRGCHILVATPGRLKHFLSEGIVSFSSVRYFVLDEADRMLDMGFLPDVEEMMSHQSMPATGERQTFMFSATFPEEIQKLACKFLHNYIFLAVGIVGSACTDVEQKFFQISKYDKRPKLVSILEKSPNDRTLIFVETKRNADFLATFLSEQNIQSTSIHGDRYQREREQALLEFKNGHRKVLVATGVAARGLDIKDVQHVINYDLPKSIDEYVHRIGRTGRLGNCGRATSFFDEAQDRGLANDLCKILSQANQEVPDWLGSYSHGDSMDQFGGRDIRGGDYGRAVDFSSSQAVNEEIW